MKTYGFDAPVDMLTFNATKFLNYGVPTIRPTEILIKDSNGDTANITGRGFSFNPSTGAYSGVVGGFFLTQNGQTVVTASKLNISLATVIADKHSASALDTLFFGGGVSITAVFNSAAANDILVGGSGKDIINANGSAVTLIGGAGADTLIGSIGRNDVFRYNLISDSTPTAFDKIEGFHAGDKIDLSLVDKTALGGGEFSISATGGQTGDLTVSYNKTTNLTTILLYDDNSGNPAGKIELTGDNALTYKDFYGVAAPAAASPATHRFATAIAAFNPVFAGAGHAGVEAHLSALTALVAPRGAQA